MNSMDKAIEREMSKSNGKIRIVYGNVFGNIFPLIEWIKWLSYEPKFLVDRINYLKSKNFFDLTNMELKEINIYNRNKKFCELFKKYASGKCSKDDYLKVCDFMRNESIEKLMISKLNSEQLKFAKDEIARLERIPKEKLSDKVKREKQKDNYILLSMIDSYILHIISDIDYIRNINDLNKKIDIQISKNDVMRQKSLHY